MSRIVRRHPAAAAFTTWLAFRVMCGGALLSICTSVAQAQIAETLKAAGMAAEATAKMNTAQLWAWVSVACVASVVAMAYLVVKVLMLIQSDMATIKAQTETIARLLEVKAAPSLTVEAPNSRRR